MSNYDTNYTHSTEELAGTGITMRVGYTAFRTTMHFERVGDIKSLCGVELDCITDESDWVGCTKCMKAARKLAA